MIRVSVTSNWNEDAIEQLANEAVGNLVDEARRRLPSVVCPEHGSSHRVTWEKTREGFGASVERPCCDKVREELQSRVNALRL